MMRKLVVSLAGAPIFNRLSLLLVAALLSGCYEKTESKENGAAGPLYRHHFSGMAQVLKGANAAKLKEIWALKSSADLRQQVLDKVATAPREFWRKHLPATASDQKDLIRPLLDDLLNAESYLEIKGPSSRPEGALALRLAPDRLTLWNNNLAKLAAAWNVGPQEPLQAGNSKGWAIKRKQEAGVVQVMLAGEWILVGIGPDKLTLLPALLEQASKASRPVPALSSTNPNMLVLDADLPHLKNWFPFLARFNMPPIHTELVGEGEYLRTKARLRFSEKIPWKPEPWKIPTNAISEPLSGFTVGQGIAPLMPGMKGVSHLGLKTYPNQFCIWSEATAHFLTFMSVPMPNASNVLREIAPKLPALIKEYFPEMPGQVGMASNRSEAIWTGLPVVVPFLRTIKEPGGEFLIGGVLPIFKRTNSPPPGELLRQFIGRNDLIYYDWEITDQSLIHSRQFWQLMDILNHRVLQPTNAPAMQWITETAPHLGNAITEVTLSAPNELTLTRKSHLGFTGSEFVSLFRWLDSSAFPFGYEPPRKIGADRETLRAARTNLQNRPVRQTNVQTQGTTRNLPPPKPNLTSPTNAVKPAVPAPRPK